LILLQYIASFDEVLDEEPRNVETSAKLDAAWKRRKSVITALQTSRDAAKLAVAQTGAKVFHARCGENFFSGKKEENGHFKIGSKEECHKC